MVEEVYYAIKRNSLQIKRKGDDANVIFYYEEGFKASGSGHGI